MTNTRRQSKSKKHGGRKPAKWYTNARKGTKVTREKLEAQRVKGANAQLNYYHKTGRLRRVERGVYEVK